EQHINTGINGANHAGRTTTGFIQTTSQQAEQKFLDFAQNNIVFRFFGGSGPQQQPFGKFAKAFDDTPSAAWARTVVPTNAQLISFKVMFSGETAEDCLRFGINGTNLLTFEAQHLEKDVPIGSGLIDVSSYAG